MKYTHPNGDTIEVTGAGLFTITRDGVTEKRDVSRWTFNTEWWIENDIKDGYYEGFKKLVDGELIEVKK